MVKKYGLYILILVLWIVSQVNGQRPVPSAVIQVMSRRSVRYHHFLWHNIRNLWNRFDNDTQNAVRSLGWAPPRPSQRFTPDGQAVPIEDNLSGEDFFFMHRQMIQTANNVTPSFRVSGWRSIPQPGDTSSPVPPAYVGSNSILTQSLKNVKSNAFYRSQIKPLEDQFKDPNYLRNVTLGQLGSRIEFSIHNSIHMRWSAASPLGFRQRLPTDPIPDVEAKWNDPAYDWLIDNYASQVNPFFWMIHGWVDDRIEDWRRANGLTTINWRGRWVGGPMSRLGELIEAGQDAGLRSLADESPDDHGDMDMNMNHGGDDDKESLEVMEEVIKVLMKTGLETHFYDPVIFEDELRSREQHKSQWKKQHKSQHKSSSKKTKKSTKSKKRRL